MNEEKNFLSFDDADEIFSSYAEYIKARSGGVSTDLLKDTVGWTGKNLLNIKGTLTSKTINGVTFTVNDDGSITANGTCTSLADFKIAVNSRIPLNINSKKFIINGCPDGGSYDVYDDVSDGKHHLFVAFYSSNVEKIIEIIDSKDVVVNLDFVPVSIRYGVSVHKGCIASNLTFYPMLRRADIADNTYEPYHETVEEALSHSGGSKTFLKQTLAIGSTTVTFTGIPTTGDYIVDFYASNRVGYDEINTSTAGTAILTFEPQSVAIDVYCVIEKVTI